jgi:hypothetical protein
VYILTLIHSTEEEFMFGEILIQISYADEISTLSCPGLRKWGASFLSALQARVI